MSCSATSIGQRRDRRRGPISGETVAIRRRPARTESASLLGRLIQRIRRRRQGFALAKLSDLALRDVGLSRIDVELEADKLRWIP